MSSNHISYEVTVSVSDELATKFERYMTERHIREVIDTGCFISATFARNEDGSFRSSYLASDHDSLERYLEEHAARLRADFAEHFPTGADATREEWVVIDRIGS